MWLTLDSILLAWNRVGIVGEVDIGRSVLQSAHTLTDSLRSPISPKEHNFPTPTIEQHLSQFNLCTLRIN